MLGQLLDTPVKRIAAAVVAVLVVGGVAFALFGGGSGIIVYIVLWVIMPYKDDELALRP